MTGRGDFSNGRIRPVANKSPGLEIGDEKARFP
jgi:hypothetical protein